MKTPQELLPAIRRENPGTVVLFREQDIVLAFGKDAYFLKQVALHIPIVLDCETYRAELPIERLDSVLHALVKNGHRVTVCERTGSEVLA